MDSDFMSNAAEEYAGQGLTLLAIKKYAKDHFHDLRIRRYRFIIINLKVLQSLLTVMTHVRHSPHSSIINCHLIVCKLSESKLIY